LDRQSTAGCPILPQLSRGRVGHHALNRAPLTRETNYGAVIPATRSSAESKDLHLFFGTSFSTKPDRKQLGRFDNRQASQTGCERRFRFDSDSHRSRGNRNAGQRACHCEQLDTQSGHRSASMRLMRRAFSRLLTQTMSKESRNSRIPAGCRCHSRQIPRRSPGRGLAPRHSSANNGGRFRYAS
jgi:hypothetical protein